MFIRNVGYINSYKYKCGKIVGKYLIKKGIPLLSRQGDEMVFSNTKELREAINNMPFYMKTLVKVGVING